MVIGGDNSGALAPRSHVCTQAEAGRHQMMLMSASLSGAIKCSGAYQHVGGQSMTKPDAHEVGFTVSWHGCIMRDAKLHPAPPRGYRQGRGISLRQAMAARSGRQAPRRDPGDGSPNRASSSAASEGTGELIR